MKSRAYKRALSLLIAGVLVFSTFPTGFSLSVDGKTTFNPLTENVVLEFDLQYTQHVSVQAWLGTNFHGYIVHDEILSGYDGDLPPHEHYNSTDNPAYAWPVPQPFSDEPAIQPFSAPAAEEEASGETGENADGATSGAGIETRDEYFHASQTTPAAVQTTPAAVGAGEQIHNLKVRSEPKRKARTANEDGSEISLFSSEVNETEQGPGHHRLTWDGTLGGYPFITAGNTEDRVTDLEIRIVPLGMPEKNVACYDLNGHVSGKNYIWTMGNDVSAFIDLDYKLAVEDMLYSQGLTREMLLAMREIYDRAGAEGVFAYLEEQGIEITQLLRDTLVDGVDVSAGIYIERESKDPVSMDSGGYHSAYPDLRIEGMYPLTFERFYNSVDLTTSGAIGQGFTHGYEYRLEDENGLMLARLPFGQKIGFLKLQSDAYHALQNSAYKLEADGSGHKMTHSGGATFDFDADGKLLRVTNPSGIHTAKLAYDGDKLMTITGVNGVFNLTYDGRHVTSVADGAGRSVFYAYDGDNLTSVTNADGDSLHYVYDENGFLAEGTDFKGETVVENEYDEKGRVTRQTYYVADVARVNEFEYKTITGYPPPKRDFRRLRQHGDRPQRAYDRLPLG
ncbi:MAG: DUF6531 domain-containing protein [Clostridiales Family XIII bacterium]|jgi:YD repeat-containing protein|nr:DUF6531 domain-containing protein [Clostridiales Family XIII bacterium]